MAKYDLTPREVAPVESKHRRIRTKLPVPESLPILEKLDAAEPRSMQGQPPIVWDRAEGFHVYDAWGNMWLDWTSCVLVANVGHGRKELRDALKQMVDRPLLATYVFPHAARAELVAMLQTLAPAKAEYKVFLLSTGSEATENAIKLARTWGVTRHGEKKHVIVSFTGDFHGRTLGAQLAGGSPKLKEWIVRTDAGFVQTPFPDGYYNTDLSFDQFLRTLEENGLTAADVAGVIGESYQGGGPNFFPDRYAKDLEAWCRENDVALIMDEVQSGFGRTGKMFCYEHYGIEPDLVCCGKGITSSLPLSAVIGRADIMDLYEPGSMTSTHSGSPLPVVTGIESLRLLRKEKLVENAASLGDTLRDGLLALQKKYPDRIGHVHSRGLVAGLLMKRPGSENEPDAETAFRINLGCFERGLLMFAPVGRGGECVKIAPPLTITREALEEGLEVLGAVCDEILGAAEGETVEAARGSAG